MVKLFVMKYVNKISIIVMSVLLFWACSSDLLTIQPVSSVSSASYWQTEDDVKGVLYKMYDGLRGLADNYTLLYWGEGRSEVYGYAFGTSGMAPFFENTLRADVSPGPSWQNVYSVIQHANLLIKYVPKINFRNNNDKNDVLSQAYAMRAFLYFWMTRIYGDLILRLDPIEGFTPNDVNVGRSSIDEVFSLIKSDIEKSLQGFSGNTIPTGRYLWSKPAVNTLKADVYLWTAKKRGGGNSDLQAALDALTEVETTPSSLELLNNFEDVFAYGKPGNNEVIFTIAFRLHENGTNWGKNQWISQTFMRSDFTPETRNRIGTPAWGSGWTIHPRVRNQFHIEDQRRNATFVDMYYFHPVTGKETFFDAFPSKYKGVVDAGTRLMVNDVPLYRYADVLLLKAEVKNALGQDPSPEINMIRKRAYGGNYGDFIFVSGSQAENDNAILLERLFEFATEAKRWFDLIRFGKVYDLVPTFYNLKGRDELLLWPISVNILALEPLVQQNPGW